MSGTRVLAACIALFTLLCTAPAQDKQPKAYPEAGTVTSTRLVKEPQPAGIYNDQYGRERRGRIVILLHVYRVTTEDRVYELKGGTKASLSVGDAVNLRVTKDNAYVQRGDKEDKYEVLRVTERKSKNR
jgi:hypothetical protein